MKCDDKKSYDNKKNDGLRTNYKKICKPLQSQEFFYTFA